MSISVRTNKIHRVLRFLIRLNKPLPLILFLFFFGPQKRALTAPFSTPMLQILVTLNFAVAIAMERAVTEGLFTYS